MADYQELWFQSTFNGYKGQPIVLIVHDKDSMAMELAGRLYEQGYYPRLFLSGEDLLKEINRDPMLLINSQALLMHKDLGQHRQSINAVETIQCLREFPRGDEIRTIVVSGEFTDRGVSETARTVIGADAGYDATGWEGKMPLWVLAMIALGRLTKQEIDECRYKETVVNKREAETRTRRFGTSSLMNKENLVN